MVVSIPARKVAKEVALRFEALWDAALAREQNFTNATVFSLNPDWKNQVAIAQ